MVPLILMLLRANRPDNRVVSPVRGGDKRRPATDRGPIHTPSMDHVRWVACSNAESRELILASATRHVCALVSSICSSCLDDRLIGNMQGSYRAAVIPPRLLRLSR